jgi:MoaA/NifB/PqqE/SkfB family radical SAM enzyme
VANIGYLQVVRHCNHFCGFCSNPTSSYVHDFESMKVLVDDLVARGYFGIILTGGEPTLHPELPKICRYARDNGLHVRMITNGWRFSEWDFAQEMADAGLMHMHVSVYSIMPDVEERLRGLPKTLERAFAAIDNADKLGISVNINCVINKLNADHLDKNIEYFIENHPFIRHFVWNNLDPSMGRAEVNQDQYTPRLHDFEGSLYRACKLLHSTGRTFRIEKVPLCYMTEFAWASTETRKIVKMEERIVHFLDDKQMVRQTYWGHLYSDACGQCSLRSICGGLFDRGNGYDPAELSPVFVSRDTIVEKIIHDAADPSYEYRTMDEWKRQFDAYVKECLDTAKKKHSNAEPPKAKDGPAVGKITEDAIKFAEKKRKAEARLAQRFGVNQELAAEGKGLHTDVQGRQGAAGEPQAPAVTEEE